MEGKLDLETLADEDRTDLFEEALEADGTDSDAGYAAPFPASGAKGWGN